MMLLKDGGVVVAGLGLQWGRWGRVVAGGGWWWLKDEDGDVER